MHITKIHSLLSNMRTKIILSMLVLSVSAVGLVAGPLTMPAAAAPDCAQGKFCLWMDPNYVNVKKTITPSPGLCYWLETGPNNNASSALNNSNYQVYMYDSQGCAGSYGAWMTPVNNPAISYYCYDFILTSQQCGPSLGRNQISSVRFAGPF